MNRDCMYTIYVYYRSTDDAKVSDLIDEALNQLDATFKAQGLDASCDRDIMPEPNENEIEIE